MEALEQSPEQDPSPTSPAGFILTERYALVRDQMDVVAAVNAANQANKKYGSKNVHAQVVQEKVGDEIIWTEYQIHIPDNLKK